MQQPLTLMKGSFVPLERARIVHSWPVWFCVALFIIAAGGRKALAYAAPPPSIDCTHGQTPQMAFEIYNNSKRFTIYPVLFAGASSATDTWMQACFQLTNKQLGDNPYPRANQYRMYVNCCAAGENGIPPGGSVQITLPLYFTPGDHH